MLEGVRVLCFTQFLLGPAAAQYLADMGADVVKVERPQGAWERWWAGGDTFKDGESVFFMLAHRNVRSVAVDLKQEEGVDVCRRLAAESDVVIGNFRSGVLDRLGLGADQLRADNPGLIYATASGYGDDSPYRDLPGQDLLVQAMTGLMSVTGSADGPPVPAGAAIVDQHAGALLAMGILGALVEKQRTGQGRRVEVNMVQAGLDLQLEPATYWRNGGFVERPNEPLGSAFHPAPYGVYAVEDGHVAISLSPVELVSEALGGVPELEPFAGISTRQGLDQRDDVHRGIAAAVRGWKRDELVSRLRDHRVWCAPVLAYPEVFADPAIEHLQPFETIEHERVGRIDLLRHPIRYDGQPPTAKRQPPDIDQHGSEVLGEILTAEELAALKAKGVVGRG